MEILVLLAVMSVGVVVAVAGRMHMMWRRERTLGRGGCPRCGGSFPSSSRVRDAERPVCGRCGWSMDVHRSEQHDRLGVLGRLDDRLALMATVLLMLALLAILALTSLSRGRPGL